MATIDKTKPVLVTGATGYVAGRIIERLLKDGITVNAAVRSPEKPERIKHLVDLAESMNGKINFFKADLLQDGSYDEAMKECELVYHTASPFFIGSKNPEEELVKPAKKGTANVLESANRTESVKRVVVTSSCAAIYGDAKDILSYPNQEMTEENWNTTSNLAHQAYSYSKTEAEKTAWEIVKQQDRWDLVVINPSFVLGPGINPHAKSESYSIIKQLANGDFKMGTPEMYIGCVDVRDLAQAHFQVGFTPEAEGRHIISGTNSSFIEIAKIAKKNFPSYKISNRKLPKFLVWLMAPTIGMTRKEVAKTVGYPWIANNSKSIEKLGMTYRPLETTLVDFINQLRDAKEIAS